MLASRKPPRFRAAVSAKISEKLSRTSYGTRLQGFLAGKSAVQCAPYRPRNQNLSPSGDDNAEYSSAATPTYLEFDSELRNRGLAYKRVSPSGPNQPGGRAGVDQHDLRCSVAGIKSERAETRFGLLPASPTG